MNELVAIGIGGALGALARHGVSHASNILFGTTFPWGTLIVNVVGSFVIGLAFVVMVERGVFAVALRPAVIVGFLGAFTTFSTFSLQTVALIEEGRMLAGLTYVGASVIVCIVAAAAGIFLGRQLT
ncbi:MAG: fluoride efflux transporter CrcB [Pseudomonadales bacterium]|nr:fluoride efflux transporter CrcB [Pseudomonadales bacterium]